MASTMEEVNNNTGNKRARKQTDRIVAASAALLAPAPKKARSTTSTSSTAKAQAQQQQYAPIVPQFETKVLPSVALSQFDKASQLVLSSDQLICHGCEVRLQ